MVPYKRALGYGFDVETFLNDEAYARIILQQARDCDHENVRSLAAQLAALMPPSSTDSPSPAPTHQPAPQAPTPSTTPRQNEASKIDQLRAELLSKYQSGAR